MGSLWELLFSLVPLLVRQFQGIVGSPLQVTLHFVQMVSFSTGCLLCAGGNGE